MVLIPLRDVVPLEEEEKDWLMNIYRKRLNYLPAMFFYWVMMLGIATVTYIPFLLCAAINAIFLAGKFDGVIDLLFKMGWGTKAVLVLIFALCGSYLYYLKKVLPFRQDALSGVKESMPFVVIKKEFFPVTGQFYVWVQGVSRHYEVDFETFYNCTEGGYIVMDRAIQSKYIFSEYNELRYY